MRRLLESDVRVGDQEGAEDGVHDGVERAGGEGSNGERDQTHADSPEETLVSAVLHSYRDRVTNLSKVQW